MSSAIPFADLLLASSDQTSGKDLFLTVAIPHYRHRRYLELVLESLFAQTYRNFEIVVSDDCSPDDSAAVIPSILLASGRPFFYYRQPANLGYDGNVRFCLRAARGRYVFLLGNDDLLTAPDTLKEIASLLTELNYPSVALTNHEDFATGRQVNRIDESRVIGYGTAMAIRHFRAFSFVSGIIFNRREAISHETDRWDRSIYYQMYLGCRIVAAGGKLAMLALSAVRKDVRIDGMTVPNYESKWASEPRSFQARNTGLASVIRVVSDAILQYVPPKERSATVRRIVAQIFVITYPYWLFEYRRVSSWSFAVGIARSMRPAALLGEYSLKFPDRAYLDVIYLLATLGGLLIPASLFNRMREAIAISVRRRFSRPISARV